MAMYFQDNSINKIWEMESMNEKVNIFFHGDRAYELIDLRDKARLYFKGPGSDEQAIAYKIEDNTIKLFDLENKPIEILLIKVVTVDSERLALTFCYKDPERKGKVVEMFDATYKVKTM
jgi:hypothetical protein